MRKTFNRKDINKANWIEREMERKIDRMAEKELYSKQYKPQRKPTMSRSDNWKFQAAVGGCLFLLVLAYVFAKTHLGS